MKKRTIIRAYSPTPIPPVVQGRTVVIQRLTCTEQSLAQTILRITQILSDAFGLSPLCCNSQPSRRTEMTESGISALFAEIDAINQKKEFSSSFFYLRDSHSKAKITFGYERASYAPSSFAGETITFSRPKDSSLEMLLNAFQEICLEFGASYGYMGNNTLKQLYKRGIRVYEYHLARTPPERHQYLVKPEPYPGVTDILPELLLSSEFDCSRVPDGIWWINYWSPLQVETVGRDKIHSADWFRVIELSNRGMVLVVTEEQTDVTNSEHMETLKRIAEALDLRGVQEQYRLGS